MNYSVALGYRSNDSTVWHRLAAGNISRDLECGPDFSVSALQLLLAYIYLCECISVGTRMATNTYDFIHSSYRAKDFFFQRQVLPKPVEELTFKSFTHSHLNVRKTNASIVTFESHSSGTFLWHSIEWFSCSKCKSIMQTNKQSSIIFV